MWEELESDEGETKIVQESGKFFDLLPVGCEIQTSSVRVYSDYVRLSESAYEVTYIKNYKDSGRTMMIVDIKQSGKIYSIYYRTNYLWDMSYMFSCCYDLAEIDLSSFDTSNVTDMSYMFQECSSLNSVDLTSFDTTNLINAEEMFSGCWNLTILDLSSWHTPNLYNTCDMFFQCQNLQTIYVSELWEMTQFTLYAENHYYSGDAPPDGGHMFEDCYNLVGGEGSDYYSISEFLWDSDSPPADDPVDWVFARIDEPDRDSPGYFTYKKKSAATIESESEFEGLHYISDASGRIKNGVIMGNGTIPVRAKCEINKNAAANTWTYTFSGINDNLQYYVWEEAIDGYTSNADENSRQMVQNGTFTIINTAPAAPKYGSLKINKQLSAANGTSIDNDDLSQGFVFNITLTKADNSQIEGSMLFGNTAFTGGKATVRVLPDRNNQDNGIVIENIPEGWNYSITEISADGYFLTGSVNDSGSIVRDTETNAVFTNEKQPEPVVPTVNVRLEKKVVGSFESIDVEFSFTASFAELVPGRTYEYLLPDGSTVVQFTADRTGSADIDLKLSSDQTIIFMDIPEGAVYRFTEEAGDYFSRYTVTDDRNLDMISSSSGRTINKNQSLSTAYETADADEEITVTFTNTINKTQDISF